MELYNSYISPLKLKPVDLLLEFVSIVKKKPKQETTCGIIEKIGSLRHKPILHLIIINPSLQNPFKFGFLKYIKLNNITPLVI